MSDQESTQNKILGYYYLHTNGDLIFKPPMPDILADFRESDLVRRWWRVDEGDRAKAWIICIEALAAGARYGRVMELAVKWGINDGDAPHFFEATGGTLGAFRDGDQWCAHFGDFINIQESQVGFGPTILEALAALATQGSELVTPVQARSQEPAP